MVTSHEIFYYASLDSVNGTYQDKMNSQSFTIFEKQQVVQRKIKPTFGSIIKIELLRVEFRIPDGKKLIM